MADAGRAVVTFVGDYKQLNAGLASTLAPAKLGKMGKLGGLAVGGALAAAVGGAAVTKALYDLGNQFDSAYDRIRVGTGKTGKQLERLQSDMKAVYSKTPADLDMVAEAVVGISQRLELTGKPMRRFALNMVELSRITNTDVGQNVANVTKLFGDFGVKTNEQVGALNKLYRAGQQSGVSVADLADNMKKFGSPLRALGMDFDTTAAMFAKFDEEGVNLQSAIPGLRRALKEFGEAGKEPKKALADVFAEIRKAPTDMKAMTIGFETFGTKAGPDMAMAVREGRFNLKGFIAEMRGGSDTILKGARDSNDAGENLRIIWHKIQNAIAPAATFIFETFTKITAWLAGPDGQKAFQTFGAILRGTFNGIKAAVAPMVKIVVGGFKAIRAVVRAVSQFINKDAGQLWAAIKGKWSTGVATIKRVAGNIWGTVKGAFNAVKNGIVNVFESAWKRVKGVFRTGANAVIGVVKSIANVINMIPGVPNIDVSNIGAAVELQRGGMLMGGAPSGDSIPALLERGEYVLNRKAVEKVGVDKLDAINYRQAPRFQTGGRVGMIDGGFAGNIVDAAGSVAGTLANAVGDVVDKAASFFIDKLPTPNIPAPFSKTGSYLIDQVSEWIRGKVPTPSSSGSFNYTGPPADFSQLGSNSYVDSHTLAVGQYLVERFGVGITDGWRPQDAGYGAANSSHKRGTPSNPGALDFAPPSTAMQEFIGKHIAGITENDIHDWGTGLHNHVAFFNQGGVVGALRKMAQGGWTKVGATIDPTAGQPQYDEGYGGMSYAELLVSGANAGLKGSSLGTMFGLNSPDWVGMPMKTPLNIRMPGRGNGHTIYKIDNGSGQTGDPRYKIDLHEGIANRLGWSPNQDVEVAPANGAGGGAGRGRRREGIIARLRNAVKDAKTRSGKQSALWDLVGGWSKYGDFGKKGREHIFGQVSKAAKTLNPLGNISTLQNLAGWMSKVGKVSDGAENTEFYDRVAKVRKKGEAKADRKRSKLLQRISGKGAKYPLKGKLGNNFRDLEILSEQIQISETTAGSPASPGGTELTDGEVKEQIGLYQSLLKNQEKRRDMVSASVGWLGSFRERMAGFIKQATDKKSPLHWKLGAFRKAHTGASASLKELGASRRDLVGITGKGGSIFDTRIRLQELGATPTMETQKNEEMLTLMREQLSMAQRNLAVSQAQMPIFQQFMPKYHSGGIVPGRSEQPAMLMGGEGVFTRDQMAAMGGGEITVNVIVEDGAVDKGKIRAEAVSALNGIATKVRTGGPTAGRSYVTRG
jgi:hypothetical protein